MSFDWANWTEWSELNAADLNSVRDGPGVYAISVGRPLERAVGLDPHGILDIGESASLRRRLKSFLRCASTPGQGGHMAGWRYARFGLGRYFPLCSLLVRWRSTAGKEEAIRLEAELLTTYIERHAELPPLNYSFNWRALDDA